MLHPSGPTAAGVVFKDTGTLGDVDETWHGEIADRTPPALGGLLSMAVMLSGVVS